MVNSVVLICPQQHRAALNALGEALGYGPETFSRGLSAGGAAPATHYGTHTWAQPGGAFMALADAVAAGQTPAGLEAYADALASMSVRIDAGAAAAAQNWDAALTSAGLTALTGEA